MVAHLLFGDPAQRVVDDLHLLLDPLAVVAALVGDAVPPVRQDGVVQLHDEPGIGDRPVLLVQRIGHRRQVLVV